MLFKPYHQRFLKVKIKSLAAESKIIRAEEKKTINTELRNGLYSHRVNDVRMETRAALIAYGYLRGRRLVDVDTINLRFTDDRRVERRAKQIVNKFGNRQAQEQFDGWFKYS